MTLIKQIYADYNKINSCNLWQKTSANPFNQYNPWAKPITKIKSTKNNQCHTTKLEKTKPV